MPTKPSRKATRYGPSACVSGETVERQLVAEFYTGLRIAGSCEHGDEPSGSIQGGEFD
jgi:hypothetical protein